MRNVERRSFITRIGALAALVPMAFAWSMASARTTRRKQVRLTDEERLSAMEKQMEEMALKLRLIEDTQAIRRLQHVYGYYLDKCLYDEVVDLFADDADVHVWDGIYRGKAGQKRLYTGLMRKVFAAGANGPVYGLLLDHLQLQDVIDIAPDGRTAKARFRCFLQAGVEDSKKDPAPGIPSEWWEGGIYENSYVKGDDGVWRFGVLSYRVVYQARYEEGWAHAKAAAARPAWKRYPEDPLGPDEILPEPPPVWPETPVVPFHYPNPVTGKPWA